MHDTCHLLIRPAYPEAALVKQPPFRPKYVLAYGDPKRTKKEYWHHRDFGLVYQTHDGKHTYVSVLEVEVRANEISLPISCKHADLHRLYLLEGKGAAFRPRKGQTGPSLTLQTDQYALLYTPDRQKGRLVLPRGRHLLVGTAVERKWQKRQPIGGFSRVKDCKATQPYPMDPLIRVTVTGLLSLPAMEGMALDPLIDGYAMELDNQYRKQHVKRKAKQKTAPPVDQPESLPPDPIVQALKKGIQQEINACRYPSVDKLAVDLGYSRQTLHSRFKKQENATLKDFITDTVMALALQLLRTDRLSPSHVAARLGYNETTSFYHQFKNYYGCTATHAQQAIEPPKPLRKIRLTK